MQDLFSQAIRQSSLFDGSPGYLWYPYGYAVGFLARRAQFLLQPDVQHLLGKSPCLVSESQPPPLPFAWARLPSGTWLAKERVGLNLCHPGGQTGCCMSCCHAC